MNTGRKLSGFPFAAALAAVTLVSAALLPGHQAQSAAAMPQRPNRDLTAWHGTGERGLFPVQPVSPIKHVVIIYIWRTTRSIPCSTRSPGSPTRLPGSPCPTPSALSGQVDSDKITTWDGNGHSQKVPSCIPDPALIGPNGAPSPTGGRSSRRRRLRADDHGPADHRGRVLEDYAGTCAQEPTQPEGLELCRSPPGYLWRICPTSPSASTPSADRSSPKAISARTTGPAAFSGDARRRGNPGTTGSPSLPGTTRGQVASRHERPPLAFHGSLHHLGRLRVLLRPVPPPGKPGRDATGPTCPTGYRQPVRQTRPHRHHPTTFAGILAYTEHNFELPPLSANDALAYDFAEHSTTGRRR